MRRLAPSLAAAALVAAAAPLASAAAQQAQPQHAGHGAHTAAQAQLYGTFVLDRAASDDVGKAIDAAVKPMNFVTRPIARGRLQKTNQAYQRVAIQMVGNETQVTTTPGAARKAPTTGAAVDWTRDDGEKFKLSMQWDGNRLVETFKAEDGQRVNAYSLSPDGSTLLMNVTITSPRLEKPLTYKLAFKRA